MTPRTAARERRARLQSEDLFGQLADTMSEVFFVRDVAQREIDYISPSYATVWGRSTESLYEDPDSFLDSLPTADRARLIAHMAITESGGDAGVIEFRVVHPDGQTRWVSCRVTGVRNEQGNVYRTTGVVSDDTQRHDAEVTLRESEERYRMITEASFDGIDLVIDGIVRDANQGFADMLGYTMDEVIFRSVYDFVADESLEEVRKQIENGNDATYELVGKKKDGSKILLEATGRTHTVRGRPARITALRDVTEKRSLQAQFHQAQKMEAVGRLASGVAHDFNNLLTVITSYASILIEEMTPEDVRRGDLAAILQAADGAASLTRQLLAFSRQQATEPRVVVLEDVVGNTKKLLERLLGEDIDLAATFDGTSTCVLIDPGQLEQVIMNLVVNARDAMPNGGSLSIETNVMDRTSASIPPQWSVSSGRFAVLVVRDTGAGMGTQTLSRVFEPFFTTKGLGKGTGLGLSTVYGIVRQSGGFIEISSTLGRGTEFRIYLPLSSEDLSELTPEKTVETVGGSETILLVEDSPLVRAAMRDVLERFGYRVIAPETSLEALQMAIKSDEHFDLLITDLVMPGISGVILGEEMKQLRPKTAILFMSGYTDEVTLRHGVTEPGVPYMQKPFTPEQLARKVREVLR